MLFQYRTFIHGNVSPSQKHSQPYLSGGVKWKSLPNFSSFSQVFPSFSRFFSLIFSLFFPIFCTFFFAVMGRGHSAPWPPVAYPVATPLVQALPSLTLKCLCLSSRCLRVASKPNRLSTTGSKQLSLFRIETARNQTEPPVNRRLGFEIVP